MTAPIKKPRVTKRGSAAYWSPDAMTRARLIWAVALMNGPEFACKATPSTLLRRAVECYVSHLERTVLMDNPKRPDRIAHEAGAVKRANHGTSVFAVLPTEGQLEYAARLTPAQTFTQAMANRQASEPTLMQRMQRDLDRWAREKATEDQRHKCELAPPDVPPTASSPTPDVSLTEWSNHDQEDYGEEDDQ